MTTDLAGGVDNGFGLRIKQVALGLTDHFNADRES
jgi:hypothetical protein